jgi:hypothetical protein
MRRVLLVLVSVLTVVGLSASAAMGSSPHFKRGGGPTCTFSGTNTITVVCSGSLAGLGNADLVMTVGASGSAVYQCQNNGGNIAPGQNRVLIGPSTSKTSIPADQVKNGTLDFSTNPDVLSAPATVSGAQAGCPGNNWTGVNPVVTLTSITLTIEQPPGTVIFTCSASNSTGLSSPVALSC